MQKPSSLPNGIPMEEAMKLASSPEGKVLLSQLQQQYGQQVESAIAQAQSGNYEQVKSTLASIMETPIGKAIMEQLRGQQHG